ncbi:hypothetical protein ACIGXM_34360 [Kitasatospora sp. NPDC052896]|uniref:hypothetical protein n=1 Tax=Kitasatospora sp. NPDC052896 TaxID=3364061 RepID=UPI0037CA546C
MAERIEDRVTAGAEQPGLLAIVGGIPFIDTSVQTPLLLTLAAEVRRRAEPEAFPALADYLDPENAAEIFRRQSRVEVPIVASSDLSDDALSRIRCAVDDIVDTVPAWRALFGIPVRYRLVSEGQFRSSSNLLIPQTIFLGEAAFATGGILRETLIHEQAHTWLNFLAELSDLQHGSPEGKLTLPSGTTGKTPRGVLYAAHFAASAVVYYSEQKFAGKPVSERLNYLVSYLAGCLNTITDSRNLTALGEAVRDRLGEFSKKVPHSLETKDPQGFV